MQGTMQKKIRTARSPPKLSLEPSRLEGRVLKAEYRERVSGLLQDCKNPVNSVAVLDMEPEPIQRSVTVSALR